MATTKSLRSCVIVLICIVCIMFGFYAGFSNINHKLSTVNQSQIEYVSNLAVKTYENINKNHKADKKELSFNGSVGNRATVLRDYVRFPCLLPAIPSPALSFDVACVRTFRQTPDDSIKSKCVPLKIMVSTPICVYDSAEDKFISHSIITRGQFEGDFVTQLMSVLIENPQLEFLDLGCNIGTYTLVAAKLSRRVVAVDPLTENIRMLSKSLDTGKIRENVTLIWNAVSDHRSVVSFQKYKGNVGGTAIKQLVQYENLHLGDNEVARAILLDDITTLFKGKQIIIKMDVETQELAVLRGGRAFFESVDVRLIQMEINWHRSRPSGNEIIDFMEERRFIPFRDAFGKTKLDKAVLKAWPGDVYFIKQVN